MGTKSQGGSTSFQKETKQPPLSKDILTDPENWPALESVKPSEQKMPNAGSVRLKANRKGSDRSVVPAVPIIKPRTLS